jgi:hypothetical protein
MKKTIILILCLWMIGGMIACNKNGSENSNCISSIQMTYSERNVSQEEETFRSQVFLDYDDILDRYRSLLSYRDTKIVFDSTASDFVKNDSIIEAALQSIIVESNTDQMGYAIFDINKDMQPELFLMDECYHIYAVFSQTNGTPMLLDSFSLNNHYVSVSQDGTFYKTGYGKGENSYTQIMQISNSGKLTILLEYGCFDNDTNYEYYIIRNNIKSIVTLQDITALEELYHDFLKNPTEVTKNSGIIFISAIKK